MTGPRPLLLLLVAILLPAFVRAQLPDPAALAAVVQFNAMCSNCHEAECSGRMSFDSGAPAEELAPWHNPQAGAYFIPLGKLAASRQQIHLEFDRAADGYARVDTDRMEIVADERLCRDGSKTIELDASGDIEHFLHLKSGQAILRRIEFRRAGG